MQVELEPGSHQPGFDVGRQDVVPGEVEAVGVGLQAVAQRDARHADPTTSIVDEADERVELFLVDLGDELGDDRTEQHRTERRTARGEIGVTERDPTSRLVPTGVPDIQLGEDHEPCPNLVLRPALPGSGPTRVRVGAHSPPQVTRRRAGPTRGDGPR